MAQIEISDTARAHIAKMLDGLGAGLGDQKRLLTLSWARNVTVKRPDGSVEVVVPCFHFGLHQRNNPQGIILYKIDNDREIGLHPQYEFESGIALIDFVEGKLSLTVS